MCKNQYSTKNSNGKGQEDCEVYACLGDDYINSVAENIVLLFSVFLFFILKTKTLTNWIRRS